MAKITKIVLAGGVSGGHTFPLIAVARALRQELPEGVEFLFIGSRGNFSDDALKADGIRVGYVLSGKMRRYFSFSNILDIFKIPIGIVQSLWHLFRFLPDAVFAKGASGSVPVVIAAWLYRIPIIIQDSDAVAGRATRFLARFAKRIAIAYPSAAKFFPKEKTALFGNPVRAEILAGNAQRAALALGLHTDRLTVFCIGGSLGARSLNRAFLAVAPQLLDAGYQIIHQTGEANIQDAEAESQTWNKPGDIRYVARGFFEAEALADALALSALVVSRAGANAISEFAALGKACILVPLPTAANDEQRANAYEVAKTGGAVVMEEANLGEHMLAQKVSDLLENAELRRVMGERLAEFHHPNAAQDLARGIKELLA